jgi:hypothetical protein
VSLETVESSPCKSHCKSRLSMSTIPIQSSRTCERPRASLSSSIIIFTSARVVIGKPQHRHHKGDAYVVRLHLTIPGAADIAVSRDPAATGRHEDLEVTLHDAFDAARRELQDLVRRRQGHVKLHEAPPHGTIAALYPERDHGFIASADGRKIYFHRNSVEGGKFDNLKMGQ